jgi:hypothetical protein
MISYNVAISDNKQAFFQEFLNLIGAKFELKNQEVLLTDEQKEILEERLKIDKSNFVSARESLEILKEKYGL